MKKTLITGATGSLGQLVVASLFEKANKEDFAVLVRDTEKDAAVAFREKGLDIRKGDYEDKESLQKALEGMEQVYLVSGSDLQNRKQQHKNVIDAAVAANVKHIFYTSSVRKSEGENAPLQMVINSHKATEEEIKNSGLDYTIFRHNLYTEVIPMFIGEKAQLKENKMIYLPAGTGKACFVPRADFAEAEAKVIASPEAHKNKTYEFNGSEKISFSEISGQLTRILETEISYVSPEVKEFEQQMKEAELPEEIIGMLSMFSQGIAEGEFNFESSDLEDILGRKTQSVRDFLQNFYA